MPNTQDSNNILFWSGGKDAFLALEFYRRQHPNHSIALLTTYDEESGFVPHQQIPIENIKEQASQLDLKIHLIPLPKNCPNDIYLQKVNDVLKHNIENAEQLIFGDWYLQDIREWRENNFKKLGYDCQFPIWNKNLEELHSVLFQKSIEIRISAVQKQFENDIKVGERYDQKFVERLPDGIDPMGERGEFHTMLVIG